MERVTVVKSFNGSLSSRPPIFHVSKPNLRERDERGEDSEISIFDAKKYFNESNEQKVMVTNRVSPLQVNLDRVSKQCDLFATARVSSASSGDGFGRAYRSRSFRATPTASSEASWNSQTGLLTNPPGAIPVTVKSNGGAGQEKKRGAAARWLFGRKCPCSGKKSVQVQEKLAAEAKAPRLRFSFSQSSKLARSPNSPLPRSRSVPEKPKAEEILAVEGDPEGVSPISRIQNQRKLSPERHAQSDRSFTFPILEQAGPPKLGPRLVDPPRDSMESLEVFLPADPRLGKRDSKSFTFPTSPRSRVMAAEDDMASDASSDLFEIDSFSTQTTTFPATSSRRDSIDEAARRLGYGRRSLDETSIAATECYAPSEASIDWSVTTATYYSVVPSECEFGKSGGGGGGGGGKRRGNGLLNCRCEEAVNVGPHPKPVGRHVSAAAVGTSGAARHVRVGVGGGAAANQPPLGKSQSARLSLALAT